MHRQYEGGGFRDASPAGISGSLKVMVASRDPDERRRALSSLSRECPGLRSIACDLDDKLVNRIRHWHPDVLVVNWDEAPVNAFELSESLRCWPELSSLRVIALSEEGGSTADPAVALVRRPFGARALRESVEGVCAQEGAGSRRRLD